MANTLLLPRMADNIFTEWPDFVLFLLFLCCDVEALIQLKCVNKYLYTLINSYLHDPIFIDCLFRHFTIGESIICSLEYGGDANIHLIQYVLL